MLFRLLSYYSKNNLSPENNFNRTEKKPRSYIKVGTRFILNGFLLFQQRKRIR